MRQLTDERGLTATQQWKTYCTIKKWRLDTERHVCKIPLRPHKHLACKENYLDPIWVFVGFSAPDVYMSC